MILTSDDFSPGKSDKADLRHSMLYKNSDF